MPISGLVVTLTGLESPCAAALAALQNHPRITVGPRTGLRTAIVVETDTDEEDRQIWEWLQLLPGVEQVDVAVIHFQEPPSGAAVAGR